MSTQAGRHFQNGANSHMQMVWVLRQGSGRGPKRPPGWSFHPSACSSDPCCPELQAWSWVPFATLLLLGASFLGAVGAQVSSVLFQQPATPLPTLPPWPGAPRPVHHEGPSGRSQSHKAVNPEPPSALSQQPGRLFRKKHLERGGMGETGAQLPGHLAGLAPGFFL